ncbi:decarboxylating NADP(+)-dependent phosphogluconate dehydrogenase [bacterium]|nr:decarboxylating NADP(+)-dependent phosphogluconate dehydrogenase [bacterium]
MAAVADIAVIGLAVMGQNLVLNMNDHGFTVAVYNRTTSKVDEFLGREAQGSKVVGAHSLEELVRLLKRPRRLMLMVQAGRPVDAVIEQLLPLLEPGDIIIDGGNSHYPDTERRVKDLKDKGILFVGAGVSGGEEGARYGPSIMPGGNEEAWPHVKDIFQAVAAKVPDGTPCCDWVGPGGAGHFVKMVHNGIEYGDMQLICECYDLMRHGLNLTADQIADVFHGWNQGKLKSFLIEITASIMGYRDDDDVPLVDKILDAAGQKGTGKWTVLAAMDLGTPLTLISEAVFARSLSARKDERVQASKILGGALHPFQGDAKTFISDLEQALFASKVISYAQGYMMFRATEKELNWTLNYGGIALMWREGCIIRSAFLGKIKEAYDRNPELANLLLAPYFTGELQQAQASWRRVVAKAVEMGIPVPATSSALAFFDGFRRERLPANLLQAQRDFFGAHTYERVDKPRGEVFHTNWTGQGGQVTAGTYNA